MAVQLPRQTKLQKRSFSTSPMGAAFPIASGVICPYVRVLSERKRVFLTESKSRYFKLKQVTLETF